MCTKTQFKNTSTNFNKSVVFIKWLMLPPIYWDKFSLVFTEPLQRIRLFIFDVPGRLLTVLRFVVHIKHMCSYNFLEVYSSQGCEWEKKMELSSFDGSVFAIVFQWAKYAGATVLHLLFREPYNSFFYLRLLNYGRKCLLFCEDWNLCSNGLNKPF